MNLNNKESEFDLSALGDGEQERQCCHARSAEEDDVGCRRRSIPRRSCDGHADVRRCQRWGIVDAITHLWCSITIACCLC